MNARFDRLDGNGRQLKRVRAGMYPARVGQVRVVSERRIAYRHVDSERKNPGGGYPGSRYLRGQRGGDRRLHIRTLWSQRRPVAECRVGRERRRFLLFQEVGDRTSRVTRAFEKERAGCPRSGGDAKSRGAMPGLLSKQSSGDDYVVFLGHGTP